MGSNLNLGPLVNLVVKLLTYRFRVVVRHCVFSKVY